MAEQHKEAFALMRLRKALAETPTSTAIENITLRALVQYMLDNDPNATAADGVTVLEAWRKAARAALGENDNG